MAAFGGADLVAGAIPDEKSFAEASARSEKSAGSAGFDGAGIENREIGRI